MMVKMAILKLTLRKLITLCIIFLLIYVLLLRNASKTENQDQYKQAVYYSNFTQYCEEYGEWDMVLHKEFYIKRSALVYFVDVDILKIPFMGQDTAENELLNKRVYLKVALMKYGWTVAELTVKEDIEYHRYAGASGYVVSFFQINLNHFLKDKSDLKTLFTNYKFDTMSVDVIDKRTNSRTKRPLEVKIKYLLGDKTKKRAMMHCSKCMYTTTKADLINLEWWIKLHLKMGYDKKYFCSHIIEDEKSLIRLAEQYKDFLELDSIKCIPNLQPYAYLAKETYLKRYTELTNGTIGVFDRIKYYAIEFISVFECYMNNIDKYRRVTVADPDEFILPRQIGNLATFESVKSYISKIDYEKSEKKDPFEQVTCDKSIKIEEFLEDSLIPKLNTSNIKHELSLHFKHGSFIFNEIADELFLSLKLKLRELNISNIRSIEAQKAVNFTLNVIKADRTQQFKLDLPFSFTVSSREELRYALRLMQMYEKTVKPFLSKYKHELKTKVDTFNRLFFVSGQFNNHVVGKSIHNTRRSMDLFIHYAIGYMNLSEDNKVEIVHGGGQLANINDFVVPRELAHLSHYRDGLNFDPAQSVVPFSAFHFDLNYFKCYMIPLLLNNDLS